MDAQDRLDNGGFADAGPGGHDPALLQRGPDGQRTLAAERERRKTATGSVDSRCQTIAATAPVFALELHWFFLQSVSLTRERSPESRACLPHDRFISIQLLAPMILRYNELIELALPRGIGHEEK
jgi:hypothetical protein